MSFGYEKLRQSINFEYCDLAIKILVLLICSALGVSKALSMRKSDIKRKRLYSSDKHVFDTVQPVSKDFVWDKTPSMKSFPFKNKPYKLTMGISSLDVQDWLLIEPTYKERTEYKEKLASNTHEDYKGKDTRSSILYSCDESGPAIREFYNIVVKYVCDKYSTYFIRKGDKVVNLIKDIEIPAEANTSEDAYSYLMYLIQTIEEDFIIMMKSPTASDEDEYRFTGGVFGFAAGFDPYDLFSKSLSSIHEPIPGYKEKLQMSMNRFFERIKAYQFITRSNFSFQLNDLLFTQGNKGRDPIDVVYKPIPYEEMDFTKDVFYRSERQTLTRLPKSNAVVFTIRTYLLPLSEIKKEGPEVCERLAGAIKGLPSDIAHYKRASEWGPATIQYLLDDKIRS